MTVVSTRWVSIAAQHVLGVEAAEDARPARRRPAGARPTADRCGTSGRPRGGCRGAAKRLCAEGGHVLGHRAPAGEHRRRQLDALGPAGRPRRVHQVRPRLDVGRRLGRRRPPPASPPTTARPACAVQPPADDDRHADPAGGVEPGRRGPRTDEQHLGPGVGEDVGHLVGVEVEVDRHGRRAGEQAAEVGEHGLDAVLGEHGDPAVGAEVELAEPVDDPVEDVVHLGPAERDVVVAQRHLVRALGGESAATSTISRDPTARRTARSSTRSAPRAVGPARSGPYATPACTQRSSPGGTSPRPRR